MSTPNFITQRDIPLMILDDTDYEWPVCPECGGWIDVNCDGSGTGRCDSCGKEVKVDECETRFDEDGYCEIVRYHEKRIERFNDTLTFFKVVLRDGYYRGVQTLVECENDPHELDNEDCRYWWDMCRSKAIRKHEAEERRVVKYLKGLRNDGLKELRCVGVFSNGEALYEYVN